jgi:CRISPR system Cascade subunit CasD
MIWPRCAWGCARTGRACRASTSRKPRKSSPTTVSRRAYLADAVFLAGLEGEDEALLARIHAALRDPVWPLSLGRKSYVPSPGPYLDDGLCQQPLEEALKGYRWLGASGRGGTRAERPTYRMVLERPDAAEGAMRMDQPLGPFAERRFGARFVVTRTWRVPDDVPEPVDA